MRTTHPIVIVTELRPGVRGDELRLSQHLPEGVPVQSPVQRNASASRSHAVSVVSLGQGLRRI